MPKTLIFDIEISPNISYTWETYETNVIEFVEEWKLLTFAYQWLGQDRIVVKGLDDYGGDEKKLAHALWALFDEADIIIGHNIVSFDIKKANAKFIQYGLNHPSHYQTVDTMRVYKKHFKDNRNSLDYICEKHSLGRKLKHNGFETWKGCMMGDQKAWKLMKRYNIHDVRLTAALYKFLLPWIDNHPNIAVFLDKECCPNCGSEEHESRGHRFTHGTRYRRMICLSCGAHYKLSVKNKVSGR